MTMTHEVLAAREEIRDVALRYCRGVDRLDVESMKSAYWPDAIDEHGNFVGNAHEFSDYCMTAHQRWRWTSHAVTNHLIELDDDGVHARGELYNVTHLCRAEGGEIDMWFGRYLDRYERRGDEWRIIHRVCVHRGTGVFTGPAMPMDAEKYRDDTFDRGDVGRPIGP